MGEAEEEVVRQAEDVTFYELSLPTVYTLELAGCVSRVAQLRALGKELTHRHTGHSRGGGAETTSQPHGVSGAGALGGSYVQAAPAARVLSSLSSPFLLDMDGVPTESTDRYVQSIRRRRGVLLPEAKPATERRETIRQTKRHLDLSLSLVLVLVPPPPSTTLGPLSPLASSSFAPLLLAHSLALSASAPQLSRINRANRAGRTSRSRAATAAPHAHSSPRLAAPWHASPRRASFAAAVPLRASLAQTSHEGGTALLRELRALNDHSSSSTRPCRVALPAPPASPNSRVRSAASIMLLSGGGYEGALASVLPHAPAWGAPAAVAAAPPPPRSASVVAGPGPRRVEGGTEASWQGEAWQGLLHMHAARPHGLKPHDLQELMPHQPSRARKHLSSARLGTEIVETAARRSALQAPRLPLHPEVRSQPLSEMALQPLLPRQTPSATDSAASSGKHGRAAARIQASSVRYATSKTLLASVRASLATNIELSRVVKSRAPIN